MEMDNITLQVQVLVALIGLISLGAGAYKIWNGFKTAVGNAVSEQFKTVTEAIAGINVRLDKIDMEASKNFLVRCLGDIEKGQGLTIAEKMRFKEQYDYYLAHGGNTYIKDEVDKYKAEGKL